MKRSLLLFALASVLLFSCKKEEAADDNTPAFRVLAENAAIFDRSFNDIGIIADEAQTGQLERYKNTCAAIEYDTLSGFKRITIDFGATNCMCKDGRERRGKIFIFWNGGYFEPATEIYIFTGDYHVNNIKVDGLRKVRNDGMTGQGPMQRIEESGKISGTDDIYNWNSLRYRIWSRGYNTPFNRLDDEWTVTGNADITNYSGRSLQILIQRELKLTATCRHIISGELEYTLDNDTRRKATLNYGNGACDNRATLTIGGNRSYDVLLR